MISHDHIRPNAQLLSPSLVGRIVEEAFEVFGTIGALAENEVARRLLLESGAPVILPAPGPHPEAA